MRRKLALLALLLLLAALAGGAPPAQAGTSDGGEQLRNVDAEKARQLDMQAPNRSIGIQSMNGCSGWYSFPLSGTYNAAVNLCVEKLPGGNRSYFFWQCQNGTSTPVNCNFEARHQQLWFDDVCCPVVVGDDVYRHTTGKSTWQSAGTWVCNLAGVDTQVVAYAPSDSLFVRYPNGVLVHRAVSSSGFYTDANPC